MRRILLIICGGVAAYKSIYLARLLQKNGYQLAVIMTKSAQEFIRPNAFKALGISEVYSDHFDDNLISDHIKLARGCDLIVVSPATANIIAKVANGICDDLASTILLAATKPILFCPAMNQSMWENPATVRNLATLKNDGKYILQPAKGEFACGEEGIGRLPEPEEIFAEIEKFFQPSSGLTAFVTAGGTIEAIDPVRVISNNSSGKQGIMIANQLAMMGVETTLILANHDKDIFINPVINIIHCKSADQMLAILHDLPQMDLGFFVAAVADWKTQYSERKISNKEEFSLKLLPNHDIAKEICMNHAKRPKIAVGFAAQTENLLQNAHEKRKNKGFDVIFVNDVSGGQVFSKDENQGWLIDENEEIEISKANKAEIAKIICEKAIMLYQTIYK